MLNVMKEVNLPRYITLLTSKKLLGVDNLDNLDEFMKCCVYHKFSTIPIVSDYSFHQSYLIPSNPLTSVFFLLVSALPWI